MWILTYFRLNKLTWITKTEFQIKLSWIDILNHYLYLGLISSNSLTFQLSPFLKHLNFIWNNRISIIHYFIVIQYCSTSFEHEMTSSTVHAYRVELESSKSSSNRLKKSRRPSLGSFYHYEFANLLSERLKMRCSLVSKNLHDISSRFLHDMRETAFPK